MSTNRLAPLFVGILSVVWTAFSYSETSTLFTNVRVFDGIGNQLHNHDVLVSGNLIHSVGSNLQAPNDAMVVDGGGRTLMPGLMDAHVHLALVRRPNEILNDYDWMYVGALAGVQAKEMLLRGFTTVRDIGGPTVGLHRAIEEGQLVGPRVLSSGPYITQTSGHGDFRNYNEPHPGITGELSLMKKPIDITFMP